MEIIKDKVNYTLNDFEKTVFTEKSLFLDIETTGFNNKYCTVYLIGCMHRDNDDIYSVLFFAETPDEEEAVFTAFTDYAAHYDRIITYNGDTFDLPFLKERMARYHILPHFELYTCPDLYKEAKKAKKFLALPDLKLKTIERFLGIEREDIYSGGELVEKYKEYVRHPQKELKEKLILHNKEDVENMIPITGIMAYSRIHEINLMAPSFEFEEDNILFSADTDLFIPREIRLRSNLIYVIISDHGIKGSLMLKKGALKLYYKNPKEYVYLLREKTVVPKAIAGAVPPGEKRKAGKEECFTEKEGLFLPLPDIKRCKYKDIYEDIHEFKEDISDKTSYILYEKNAVSENFLTLHINNLLSDLTY